MKDESTIYDDESTRIDESLLKKAEKKSAAAQPKQPAAQQPKQTAAPQPKKQEAPKPAEDKSEDEDEEKSKKTSVGKAAAIAGAAGAALGAGAMFTSGITLEDPQEQETEDAQDAMPAHTDEDDANKDDASQEENLDNAEDVKPDEDDQSSRNGDTPEEPVVTPVDGGEENSGDDGVQIIGIQNEDGSDADDVEILGVDHNIDDDGNEITYGDVSIDGEEVILIDVDGGEFDYAVHEDNVNDVVEVYDISDEHISVQEFEHEYDVQADEYGTVIAEDDNATEDDSMAYDDSMTEEDSMSDYGNDMDGFENV